MRRAGERGCPPRVALLIHVFLMLALVFLSVKLLEENRELRQELKKWEALKLHVKPPKNRR